MKKLVIACTVLSLCAIAISVFALSGKTQNNVSSLAVDGEYTIIAGVIRNTGNGWELLNDDGHEPIGIIDISQDNDKIIVTYAEQSKVGALSVTVDETMASEGYRVGTSVGLDKSYIFIYDKENKQVSPKDYMNELGNIWIEGIFKK